MREAVPGLKLSEQLFRKFLVAYSPEYREEFGDEMAQVFRDLCLDVYRRKGAVGLAKLWMGTFVDLLITAFQERLRTLPLPPNQRTVTLGGWSAIAGGLTTLLFAFTHASPNWARWAFRLEWVWPVMGLFYLGGLIAMAVHRRSWRQPVGAGLSVALLGAVVMVASGLAMLFLSRIWISYGNGLLLLAGGLAWMGLMNGEGKYLPRLNSVLLANGLCMLLFSLFVPARYMGMLFQGDTALFAALMGIGWIVTGLAVLTGRDDGKPPRWREV